MKVYRYVSGGPGEIVGTKYSFTSFGQLVEMPEDLAEYAIANRVHLVPKEIWDEVGITDAELKRHSRFERHAHTEVTPEFLAKRDALWRKSNEHQEAMRAKLNPPPPKEEAPAGSPEREEEVTNA